VSDKRTQQATIFNLLILGEAAGNVLATRPEFTERHPELPWRIIRATRNRLVHGYFDLNLDVIWDTVHTALPALLSILPEVISAAHRECTDSRPPTAAP